MIKRARTLFKHFSSTSVHHTELLKQTHTALQQAEEKRGHGLTRLWKKPKEKSWVLLIGKHGAGKTTLLEKSQYPLRSPFKKSIKNINETKNIDWWIGDDLVFIDPAGKYCFSTPLEQEHYQYWQNFLSILSQKYPHPFDSVSLIVDLPTLIYHQDISFDDFVRRWQEQIRLLENFCDPLCINIIVTQCDYLAGYAEFFANLDSQQQQQVFGFSLMDSSQTTHVHDLFVQRFHDFIQIVNQRTLNRLHQEPNHERRLRIHDFPLQLEKLEKPLFALLNALSDSNTLFVNNVFFCNSAQTTHPIHLLNDDLNKTFQLKATNEAPLVAEERVFFTHDLIPELGKANIVKPILRKTTTNKWWHFSSYPLAIIVIIILTAIYHHSYRNNLSAINAIATSMTQPNGQLAWLSELNHLKQAEEATDRYKLGNYRIFGFNQGYELTQEIKRQYNWRLTHQFIPYLNESIVTKIKQDSDTNSPELYNSLMVYLMMGQQDERDDAFIKNWFHKLWKNQFPDDPKSQRNLNQYLYDVLRNPIVHWKKDKDLVQQSNEALQKQPLADIAYRMLRNNSRLDSLPLKNGMSIEGIDLSKASIPVFYSTNNFALIYKKEIPHLAEAIFKGKSILQNKHSTDLTLEKLIAQLQLMYVQRYLSNWNTSMQQIAFQQPKNFKQAAEQTNLITNPHSPLWQIYQHAIDAITRSSGEEDLKKAFAENNINLADYMPSADKAKNTAKALNQLQAYLQRINDAPSPVKAAYDAAAQRYNENDTKDVITNVLNTAKSLPNPLQHWTEEMARNDWKLMLDNSKDYLNILWKTNIVSAYHKTIANRFPIYNESKDDIAVNDFNQFFGPGGIIQNYFNTYLKPFVDMSQPYWVWKSLDGEKIPIPQSGLDMLLRASMIQQMFYTNNPNAPTLNFTLQPVDMSIDSSQFTLNIGGQMLRYTPGIKKISELQWPGSDGEFVTARFDDTTQDNPTLTTMGPWAWLRLLNSATIQPNASNPRQFQVTFKLGTQQINYQLIADNPVNPYTPNVLSQFRCPEKF